MNFSTRVVLYVIVAISLSQYALELADIEDAFVLLCVVLIFELGHLHMKMARHNDLDARVKEVERMCGLFDQAFGMMGNQIGEVYGLEGEGGERMMARAMSVEERLRVVEEAQGRWLEEERKFRERANAGV